MIGRAGIAYMLAATVVGTAAGVPGQNGKSLQVIRRYPAPEAGGVRVDQRRFYTSGHHAPELYVLDLPETGTALLLREIITVESEGQGIAFDRDGGLLSSFQRRTREVLISKLPR